MFGLKKRGKNTENSFRKTIHFTVCKTKQTLSKPYGFVNNKNEQWVGQEIHRTCHPFFLCIKSKQTLVIVSTASSSSQVLVHFDHIVVL